MNFNIITKQYKEYYHDHCEYYRKRYEQLMKHLMHRFAAELTEHPRRFLYSLTGIVVLTVFCIFFLQTSPVNAQSEHVSSKYFTVVEVESGDTLWDIAQEYKTSEYSSTQEYIEEIQAINHISGDAITSGCYLTIPYYAEAPLSEVSVMGSN